MDRGQAFWAVMRGGPRQRRRSFRNSQSSPAATWAPAANGKTPVATV